MSCDNKPAFVTAASQGCYVKLPRITVLGDLLETLGAERTALALARQSVRALTDTVNARKAELGTAYDVRAAAHAAANAAYATAHDAAWDATYALAHARALVRALIAADSR